MEQLAFTALLNRLFGAPVLALLLKLNIHPKYPATPITNAVAMEILVVLLLTIFFIAVRSRLSVERPGALQHTMEGIDGFVNGLAGEIIGHHSAKYRSVPDCAGTVYSELQSDWAGAGTGIAHGGADGAAGLRAADLVFLPLSRPARKRRMGIFAALRWTAGRHAACGADHTAGPVFSY